MKLEPSLWYKSENKPAYSMDMAPETIVQIHVKKEKIDSNSLLAEY